MANKLYQQMQNNSNYQFKQALNNVKNSFNPNMIMNQMANNNPQMQQILNLVKQNGGDAKGLFYQKAKQMGVDPNTIINMLK